MGKIVEFFTFLWKVQLGLIQFMIGVPGLIVNGILGIVVALYSLISNVYTVLDKVIIFLTSAKEHVTSFVESISDSYLWAFFYKMFALDTFGEVFSSFVTLSITVVVLTVFEMFFTAICTAVPLLIYKSVGKIIQALSAGFVKPS